MTSLQEFSRWYSHPSLPEEMKQELIKIKENDSEIADRFGRALEFGTGGLRGRLGAGLNRMNVYTVGKATQGLANYLKNQPAQGRLSVAISHDSRHQSPEFARHVAQIFAQNGIQAFLWDSLRPTPMLSFAVRHLGASAGIVITASHNPPDYNGYKVYGADGGQLLDDAANAVTAEISAIEDEFSVTAMPWETALAEKLIVILDSSIDEAYQASLLQLKIAAVAPQMREQLNIVYTPLHGTGNIPVREGLKHFGYTNVHIVAEQELPDPNFSTVTSPNPEESQAFELSIQLAKQVDADLIMGTDPDADRVGVVVKDASGQQVVLTGNQTGGLLLDFLLSQYRAAGTLPRNGIVFKTIVTSELGRAIADQYGLRTEDTLTGFKYIADRIGYYERTDEYQFLFGYEESYGYLIAPFVRDKDAVQACLLIAEMAAFYKSKGLTLYDALLQLFERVGYYKEALVSLTLPGQEGMMRIKQTMEQLRQTPPVMSGFEVTATEDYLKRERIEAATGATQALTLPQSDVLKYIFADQSWVAIRPSGTEPKIKLYIGVKGSSLEEVETKLKQLSDLSKALLQ